MPVAEQQSTWNPTNLKPYQSLSAAEQRRFLPSQRSSQPAALVEPKAREMLPAAERRCSDQAGQRSGAAPR